MKHTLSILFSTHLPLPVSPVSVFAVFVGFACYDYFASYSPGQLYKYLLCRPVVNGARDVDQVIG